jgi:S1-C subfamily serine protease
MNGSTLDVVLLVAALVFAVSGYRQGFVVGALSFAGFFGGALLGVQVAPIVANRFSSDVAQLAVALIGVFVVAVIGQTVAVLIGGRLREQLHTESLRTVDSFGGALISAVAVLLVAWMVATPLGNAPAPWLAAQVKHSAVIGAVDGIVPAPVRKLYKSFGDVVGRGDFPNVFDPLTPTQVTDVDPPNSALAKSPAVTSARRSVVKVLGIAPSCDRRLEGTGFFYAPHRVMTNAHVVAGTRSLKIELRGKEATARVVVYDPQRDLAVLFVPDLDAPAMPFAPAAATSGTDSIVIGFPLDGPFKPTPARIRDSRNIKGPDIYNAGQVRRQVYTLRSNVLSGNSGGPLVALNGTVYGVIFAAAVDDPETGFALTAAEARSVATKGRASTDKVGTGACD